MNDSNYHHGNLRQNLIEKGIELLNAEGYANLSLRRVAKACSVSHAAPYNHFKDKDELLLAMQRYVEMEFAGVMRWAAEENAVGDVLIALGLAYIRFFIQNPAYFRFVQTQDNTGIVISRNEINSNYLPFNLFRDEALKNMEAWGVPKDKQADMLAAMWAIVHGVTAMATMQSVVYDGDWCALGEEIMRKRLLLTGENV